jgi:hypothetical protein
MGNRDTPPGPSPLRQFLAILATLPETGEGFGGGGILFPFAFLNPSPGEDGGEAAGRGPSPEYHHDPDHDQRGHDEPAHHTPDAATFERDHRRSEILRTIERALGSHLIQLEGCFRINPWPFGRVPPPPPPCSSRSYCLVPTGTDGMSGAQYTSPVLEEERRA